MSRSPSYCANRVTAQLQSRMPRKQRPNRPRTMASVTVNTDGRTSSSGPIGCANCLNSAVRKWHIAILVSATMALFLALALFSGIFFGISHRPSDAAALSAPGTDVEVHVYGFEKVAEYAHDPNAFTQGLLYYKDNILFESTGMYGQSSVREVDLITGKVLRVRQLARSYFGEGLTLWKDRLLQVLWLTSQGFSYDKDNFSQSGTFTHPMKDGWGLTGDGEHVIGSDGSSTLYFIDPTSFAANRTIEVRDGGKEVSNLNELEYIKDEIWANIWQTNCIVRVSPEDGHVLGWILLPDLSNSLLAAGHRVDVLNGIAWDSNQDRIFVTGKYWPKLYEIKLRSAPENMNATVARQMCIL